MVFMIDQLKFELNQLCIEYRGFSEEEIFCKRKLQASNSPQRKQELEKIMVYIRQEKLHLLDEISVLYTNIQEYSIAHQREHRVYKPIRMESSKTK